MGISFIRAINKLVLPLPIAPIIALRLLGFIEKFISEMAGFSPFFQYPE